MVTRRRLLFASAAASAAALTAASPQSQQQQPQRRRRPPNILVILADDQGWGDLSIHGNTNLATPHIDSIGRDGALFDRFFVCPVCAPTRAEFFTGRFYPRTGVRGVSTGEERLNLDERTIAQTFREAGYATGAFGKWHNGSQHPYHPNARGFDEYYGFPSGHWGQYFDPQLDHNGRLVRGKGFIVDDFTDHALAFIERNRERPFFCYLPVNTPHSPMQVPDKFYTKFASMEPAMRATDPALESLEMTRAALAMVENLDWNVGRVLSALDRAGLREDTIVLYFSDNGPNSWRWNGGMKGRKGSVDEGGVRSPLLVRWPGRIKPGTRVGQIAGAIDLLPTLTSMAGIPTGSKKPIDGRDLTPLLLPTGKTTEWPDRALFHVWAKRVSARTQRFRLDAEGRLFDMLKDPAQSTDIAAREPEVAARLREAVQRFSDEALPKGPDSRPFPVGHFATTYLPARDGRPHAGVRRSAAAPNCSFFTNWTSTADSITWDIEVPAEANYEAVLHYTCRAADVGSAIRLSFLGRSLDAKITEAHDPPFVAAKLDRTKDRGQESDVKDFRPMRLGEIRLAKGRGLLTLAATEVAGRQVADVRYLELRLAAK